MLDYDGAQASAATGHYPPLFHGLLDRGVALAPGAYEVLFPSLAHTDADIERTVEAAGEAAADRWRRRPGLSSGGYRIGHDAGDGGDGPVGRLGRAELVGRSRLAMMRRTHSIRVRLRMPVDTRSRISSGRPMIFTNARATLKYRP